MKIRSLLCCLLALLTLSAAAKDVPGTSSPAVMARRYDSLFRYLEAKQLFNGNVLIAVAGKPVYERSVGFADLKTGEPLSAASVFELASVSKQFTAAGVLLLAERKRIALDQDVRTILGGLPYRGITVRMLLNHTSGLPDYMELFAARWDSTKIATNKDLMPMLEKYHPHTLFAPGAQWSYSNTGYALLACIIEQVSGKPFADYMQQEVFRPLGMTHTLIYSRRLAPRTIPHYAFGYVSDTSGHYLLPDELSPNNYVRFLDGIQGDGTVNTTAADLLRWDNAVHRRMLLSAGSWKAALTPVTPADGKDSHYGFGWMVKRSPKHGRIWEHSGSWPGYTTYNILYPDRGLSLICLSNRYVNPGTEQEIISAIRRIALGEPFTLPQEVLHTGTANIDKSVYSRYAGTYNMWEGFDVVISAKDGRLYAEPTDQPKLELLPESNTLFFVPDLPIKIEFQVAADASVPSFILHQNGQHQPAHRK